MKRTFFIICLYFAWPLLILAQGSWERVQVPTTQFLRLVFFVDTIHGWASGDSGTIIRTVDGGKNWHLLDPGIQNDISSIFFLNPKLGFATALNFTEEPYGTIFLKTTDGGDSWTKTAYPQENVFMWCIYYLDSLNGWMGGRPHALVKTVDGGLTWTQAAVDTSILAFFPVLTIQFYDENYGYASGGMFDIAGVIWRTSNGGEKWYAIDPSEAPADEVRALHLYDSIHVIGAGGDPDYGYGVGMIRTSNGGLGWEYEELGMTGLAFDIDFRTDYEAWAPLGPQRKMIFSLDSGNTWTEFPTPDTAEVYNMTFADSLHGFAVGSLGTMLRYIPKNHPSVEQIQAIRTSRITVGQNHPNPSPGMTNIDIIINPELFNVLNPGMGSSTRFCLEISDLPGAEVVVVNDLDLVPGENAVQVSTLALRPGIYFYRIKALTNEGGKVLSAVRKMIVL